MFFLLISGATECLYREPILSAHARQCSLFQLNTSLNTEERESFSLFVERHRNWILQIDGLSLATCFNALVLSEIHTWQCFYHLCKTAIMSVTSAYHWSSPQANAKFPLQKNSYLFFLPLEQHCTSSLPCTAAHHRTKAQRVNKPALSTQKHSPKYLCAFSVAPFSCRFAMVWNIQKCKRKKNRIYLKEQENLWGENFSSKKKNSNLHELPRRPFFSWWRGSREQ